MRVRVDDLLAERGWSAYDLAKAAAPYGVSEMAIYRLARAKGVQQRFDSRVLAVMCEVFGIEPNELLERDKPHR